METRLRPHYEVALWNEYAEVDDILIWYMQYFRLGVNCQYKGIEIRYVDFPNGNSLKIDYPEENLKKGELKTTLHLIENHLTPQTKITKSWKINSRDEFYQILMDLADTMDLYRQREEK